MGLGVALLVGLEFWTWALGFEHGMGCGVGVNAVRHGYLFDSFVAPVIAGLVAVVIDGEVECCSQALQEYGNVNIAMSVLLNFALSFLYV